MSAHPQTNLSNKIDHVLTEARLVLPGIQALFGFQLTTFLTESFEKLPSSLKYLHLISSCLMALSTIFLITPAAYHRIVEKGEESEEFHRFATRMILAAMVALAFGVCGDLFVVCLKITESKTLSIFVSCFILALYLGLWFGFTLVQRARKNHNRIA
jgi:hypothetical protein